MKGLTADQLESARDRFWGHVDVVDDLLSCWLWTAYCNAKGYGHMPIKSRPVRAHRFAYELTKGPIPEGLFVCHTCDVRNCVRPDHLFLGTHKQNMEDMASKGRSGNHNNFLTKDQRFAVVVAVRSGNKRQELAEMYGVTLNAIDYLVKCGRYG